MSKTTVAQLEAALTDTARNVLELAGAVALLNERLNKASDAFKAQRAEIAELRAQLAATQAARPVTRVQLKAQTNPWFVALKELRDELKLAEGAWVDEKLIRERMARNAEPQQEPVTD